MHVGLYIHTQIAIHFRPSLDTQTVCMHVCMHVGVYVHTASTYICTDVTYTQTCLQFPPSLESQTVCMHVCMHVGVYVHTDSTYTQISMCSADLHMQACMYTYKYAYILS
jgi:hypothetical protein